MVTDHFYKLKLRHELQYKYGIRKFDAHLD